MKSSSPGTIASLLSLASLSGCVSSAATEPRDPVFDYLASRYDRDQDGRITREEYDREGGDFVRLDHDADGVLTASDFEAKGRRQRGLGPRQAKIERARHLVAWFFQDDDETDEVSRVEVTRAFRAYDIDGDGRVGRTEFEVAEADRSSFGREPGGRFEGLLEVETTDPWERLLHGIDRDDDGFLVLGELEEFYAEQSQNASWSFGAEGSSPALRSLVGELAPDFRLKTLDGGAEVTLSDFADDRPVALIFGSYT